MKNSWTFLLLFILLPVILPAQNGLLPYHEKTRLFPASPGALQFGLYGYDNPALLTYARTANLMVSWTDANGNPEYRRLGLFYAGQDFALGLHNENLGDFSASELYLASAFGSKEFSLGYRVGYVFGDREGMNRRNNYAVGALIRPVRYASLGLTWNTTFMPHGSEGVVDLGIRPFGDELVTLFADYALVSGRQWRDGRWSAGAVVEPLPGLRIAGRYFDTDAFSAAVQISLGTFGYTEQVNSESGSDRVYNTHSIRVGARDRSFLADLMPGTKYVKYDMKKPVKYQKFQWFDNSRTLLGILQEIDAAKRDPAVKGLALNLSGMNIGKEFLWEIREKLKEFRSSGKKVVVYIDRGGISAYHLASVADKIVMDPLGTITLEGFLLGRMYVKGTLEKLGIGFEEWRYLKYKSANETFSRSDMSDADREQLQAIVDDYYQLAKDDICEGRGIEPSRFDSLVNNTMIFLSRAALESGLVDTLGRWDAVDSVIATLEGKNARLVSPGSVAATGDLPDHHWGSKPRIAVIYALGVCDMDVGIAARKLVKDVENVAKDGSVKAVVLRVDSPGGDALASDIIAEAIKKCGEKKPVIVSQGSVAASGGYWLSMYGDTIIAAPTTITGSIGVIGGWFYNLDLKESLGVTTDFVKRGEHADLGFGLLGMLPDRNLTEAEHARIKGIILDLYKEFVDKVAEGRGRTAEGIDSIAQGRIWSGYDGLDNGLVDLLGGLTTAVDVAKQRAGFEPGDEVEIVEYPVPGLFDLSQLLGGLVGSDVSFSRDIERKIELLKFMLRYNGVPMPMLPISLIDLKYWPLTGN